MSFVECGITFRDALSTCSADEVAEHVLSAGVIPERIRHDSTEEKLWAKYCDNLLARALQEFGFEARAIEARGDAADVEASGAGYTLVGDAKAFRLSRTAKNQKDFKVEALNEWRQGADFAVLICPLYQYPASTSQIYNQAIRYNVTLLSYEHVGFLLRSQGVDPARLRELWKCSTQCTVSKSADAYWRVVDEILLRVSGMHHNAWAAILREQEARLAEQARLEIAFWNAEKERIRSLDHDTATDELIKALKINSKIDMIGKSMK